MSRKLKGILDNRFLFYVVLLVTLMTIVSQLINGQLFYIVIFAIVSGVTYQLNKNYTVCMLFALMATWGFVLVRGKTEGFESDDKDKEDESKSMDVPEKSITSDTDDPMGLNIKESFEDTKELFKIAEGLQPMMNKLSGIIDKLPEDFVNKAIEKMKNRNKK